jgi:hypothetical protein
VLALVCGLLLFRLGNAYIDEWRRADVLFSPLNLPTPAVEERPDQLVWLPDAADIGRSMEPYTRRQLEEAYLQAWQSLENAWLQRSPDGLGTWFAGPQLDAVTSALGSAPPEHAFTLTTTGHRLELTFYSADGSIVGLRDRGAEVRTTLHGKDGTPIATIERVDRYVVVLFLEDGNWRVRHWQRQSAD